MAGLTYVYRDTAALARGDAQSVQPSGGVVRFANLEALAGLAEEAARPLREQLAAERTDHDDSSWVDQWLAAGRERTRLIRDLQDRGRSPGRASSRQEALTRAAAAIDRLGEALGFTS